MEGMVLLQHQDEAIDRRRHHHHHHHHHQARHSPSSTCCSNSRNNNENNNKVNFYHKVLEFGCGASLFCVSCPLSIVWCCIKLPFKIGWKTAEKYWICCCGSSNKMTTVYADYSSFSDIDSDSTSTMSTVYRQLPLKRKDTAAI